MLKTISLKIQKTTVDFLFYKYDNEDNNADSSKFHKHLNYEIHFALEGSYKYEFADKNTELKKNQMLIIPPRTLHKGVDMKKNEYKFTVLTLKFSATDDDEFYNYFNRILKKHASEAIEVGEEMIKSVAGLHAGLGNDSYLREIYLINCASEVLYKLCAMLSEGEEEVSIETEKHLDVCIENLVNDFNMSLGDIAKRINYSPRQTERLIKKIYGKSLTEVREDFK